MTMPFLKQMTAGRTRILSLSTKNLAFSTFILANLVSKCRDVRVCNQLTQETGVKSMPQHQWSYWPYHSVTSNRVLEAAVLPQTNLKASHQYLSIRFCLKPSLKIRLVSNQSPSSLPASDQRHSSWYPAGHLTHWMVSMSQPQLVQRRNCCQ